MDGAQEDRLAARAAAGEAEAFERLLGGAYPRILRLGWRLTGSAAEAEDLAQEVCLRLGQRIRQFRAEAAFRTWLYRVVLNAARDRARASARRGQLESRWAEADGLARAGAEARAAEIAWLREALSALGEDLRETAVLVLDEGLSHAEAGAVLGVSAGTVSWRMSEIRRRLRAMAAAAEEGA